MSEEDLLTVTDNDLHPETYTVFGISLYNVFKFSVAIAIFVASVFARKYISQGAMFVLHSLKLPKGFTDTAQHLLAAPLSFATVFAGFWLSAHILDLPPELDWVMDHVAETVVNLAFFWALYFLIDPVANVWMATSSTHHNFGEEIKEIVTKIAKAIIATFGVLAIFEVWDIKVTAFLAGLGLAGAAVALAAQDTVKNLFGSFVIIMDRVFHKGDFIISGEVSGVVEHFGIRVTQVRKLDTTLVFVPNATLSNSIIINLTQGKRREISWAPKLAGNTEDEIVENVLVDIRHYLKSQEDIEQEASTPIVQVSDVTDGTVTLMIYFHFKLLPWGEHVAARERVALKVKDIVQSRGAGFAIPGRNVILHQ